MILYIHHDAIYRCIYRSAHRQRALINRQTLLFLKKRPSRAIIVAAIVTIVTIVATVACRWPPFLKNEQRPDPRVEEEEEGGLQRQDPEAVVRLRWP